VLLCFIKLILGNHYGPCVIPSGRGPGVSGFSPSTLYCTRGGKSVLCGAALPGFPASSTIYFMKSTSMILNPGRPADKPSTRAFHHRTPPSPVVKKNPRSLELLNFQKSEIAVTHIQILIYYSTFIQTKTSQSKSFRDQVVFFISTRQYLSAGGNDLYWWCFEKAFRRGRALNILHDS